MKTNEILNRLSNLYHQYDIVEDKDLKSISNALMRDMPKYVLNDVRYNWLKRGLNYTLCAKARGFLKHREKVVRFNEPISVLLDYYNNKRSRKVVYARTQLKRRFEYMDGSEQKQIILSFLNGSKWDVFWGMSKALFRWDNSLIVSTNCSEEYTEPILLDYRLGKYIWSMGKLGMHDALFRLYEFLIKAKTHIEAYNLNGLCNVIKTELEKTQQ